MNTQTTSQVTMMRHALKELHGASPVELSAFLESRYGVRIAPKYIPILRASVREQELQEAFRQRMRDAANDRTDAPPQAL